LGLRIAAIAIGGLIAAGFTAAQRPQIVVQPRTLASLWYRGLPAGVPRQADLDEIRAAGFTAVTWPVGHVTGALELRRMADAASLKVVIRSEPVAVTAATALRPDSHVDISVPRTASTLYSALTWRVIAHGARVVSFDADMSEGTGLQPTTGQAAPWVSLVSAVARQIAINGTLIDTLSAGPAIRLERPVSDLDVALLEAPRAWVLVATNTAAAGTPPADTYAIMPPGVPPALWLNLFDGTTIGMSSRPTGARWHVVIGPGDARVYVIDKVQK
jgi:hypothetical protein